MHTNDDPLLVGDAARRIEKSPATIRGWIRNGRLKAERTPGGVHIIRPADLRAAQLRRRDSNDPAAA